MVQCIRRTTMDVSCRPQICQAVECLLLGISLNRLVHTNRHKGVQLFWNMGRVDYRLWTSRRTIIVHHSNRMYLFGALFHGQILFVSKVLSKNQLSAGNRRVCATDKLGHLLGLLHSFIESPGSHWTRRLGAIFNVSLFRQRTRQLWRNHLLTNSIEQIVLVDSSGRLENLLVIFNSRYASLLMLIGWIEILNLGHNLIWVQHFGWLCGICEFLHKLTLINLSIISIFANHALSALWFLGRSRRLLWINVQRPTSYRRSRARLHSHEDSCSNSRLTGTSCSHASVRSSASIPLFKERSLSLAFNFASSSIGLILRRILWLNLIWSYFGAHYERRLRSLDFPRSMNLWTSIL